MHRLQSIPLSPSLARDKPVPRGVEYLVPAHTTFRSSPFFCTLTAVRYSAHWFAVPYRAFSALTKSKEFDISFDPISQRIWAACPVNEHWSCAKHSLF